MSTPALAADARIRPDLFIWNGSVDQPGMQLLLARDERLARCPSELQQLWRETGGGDIFESEAILGPLSKPALGEDILRVNEAMVSKGMPQRFVVFHIGMITTAVDTVLGDYVQLDAGFYVIRRFGSLEQWYVETVREEYHERYGLP